MFVTSVDEVIQVNIRLLVILPMNVIKNRSMLVSIAQKNGRGKRT